MSVYISIGYACNVKFQIDKYKGKKETLFFDNLMIDNNSVISILGCNNIDEILNFNNIIRDENNPIVEGKSRILIKSLSDCVSIHDIGANLNDKDIFDFIDKYKRRYYRIINYIKSDKKVYFIKFGSINNNEKDTFINTIKNVNPLCNFALVSIILNKEIGNIIKDTNFLEINLKDNYRDDDWTTSYLDWGKIFKDVETNI